MSLVLAIKLNSQPSSPVTASSLNAQTSPAQLHSPPTLSDYPQLMSSGIPFSRNTREPSPVIPPDPTSPSLVPGHCTYPFYTVTAFSSVPTPFNPPPAQPQAQTPFHPSSDIPAFLDNPRRRSLDHQRSIRYTPNPSPPRPRNRRAVFPHHPAHLLAAD
ncbi:hypothetical protein DFH09DRAFT_1136372 [Mycena vulgaris]|nr:hypothetical protein DFH09DRAFT_1136372 [Mycena vulgaris]